MSGTTCEHFCGFKCNHNPYQRLNNTRGIRNQAIQSHAAHIYIYSMNCISRVCVCLTEFLRRSLANGDAITRNGVIGILNTFIIVIKSVRKEVYVPSHAPYALPERRVASIIAYAHNCSLEYGLPQSCGLVCAACAHTTSLACV